MNNKPPPYNPYMYNNHMNINNIATAPTIDLLEQNQPSYQQSYNPQVYSSAPTYPTPQIYSSPPTYPPQIYIPPNVNYKSNVEQYREDERQRRRNEDECCFFAICATLCCCCII